MENIFKREFFKKDIAVALVCALIFSSFMALAGFDIRCRDLREHILRLHILGNSNSEADQAVKLKVRDKLLTLTEELYENAGSKEEAIRLTDENRELITAAAEEVLKSEGFDYGADISVGDAYFETREYDTFTLPAGNYKAVKVKLGEARGKNWWCVMFPSLCIPAAGSEHSLTEAVSSSSAEIAENPTQYKIGFKAVEIYEDIKNFFKALI